jgi:hypothetical protein
MTLGTDQWPWPLQGLFWGQMAEICPENFRPCEVVDNNGHIGQFSAIPRLLTIVQALKWPHPSHIFHCLTCPEIRWTDFC